MVKSAKSSTDKKKALKGNFRCFSTTFIHQPPFTKLSSDAKLVYFVLAMELGPSGLAVFYEEVLPRLTSLLGARVSEALMELENKDLLRRGDNVYWLVRSLEHQPTYTMGNDNHRKSIEKHVRSLPMSSVLASFIDHYGLSKDLKDVRWMTSHAPSHAHTDPDPHRYQETGSRKQDKGNYLHNREREREETISEINRSDIPTDRSDDDYLPF